MADDTDNISFKLDLDAKEFTEALKRATEVLDGIADDTRKTKMATMFTAFTEGAHLASEVMHKLGEAAEWVFDQVLEGEKLKAVNYQFMALSKQAGLSGEHLKESFEKAAAGATDLDSILGVANSALLNMGSAAGKLPELFEVAKKSAALFGGTALEKFQILSKAVEYGNQRMLRQAGIVIDVERAVKKFADAHGVGAASLSEMARRQAILNEVLEFGQKKMINTPKSLRAVTTSFQELITSIKELGDGLASFLEATLGPVIKWTIDSLKSVTKWVKGVAETITWAEDQKTRSAETGFKTRKEIQEEEEKSQIEAIKTLQNEDIQDKQKRIDAEIKFQQQKLEIRKQALEDQQALETTDEQIRVNQKERIAIIEEEYALRAKQLREDQLLDAQQKSELLVQLENEKWQKIKAQEDDFYQRSDAAAERSAKKQASAWDKFAGGATAASKKASNELKQFEKTGEFALNAFTNRASDAFVAIGEGSQGAGEAMKGFMFGALADIAQAQGSLLLASALVNPLNAAAGAALLVLSGVLRSMSKTSKAASGLGGSYGGEGAGYSSSPATSAAEPQDQLKQQEQQKRGVVVNVQGHYFETEETKRQLQEIIRQYQDATDFTFRQIGATS